MVRALGTGGTAVVYLVHNTQTGRPHALKVLSVTSQTIRTRMQREGHVQAQLEHPNVVQIHEVLDLDGSPALLMEYVNGTTLDAALKRYRLNLDDAEILFSAILDGVQAAHLADLVHRDLKPANVLLARTTDGFVPKVADFGLAKVLFPEPGTAHTRAGISMGTPSYMAPEQIRDAGSVDQRADLWSLGCLLYEIVTRKRAFPGRQALNIYNNVVNGRYEPPQNFVPDLPERVQQAISGCLQIDPDRRIPNCHTLQEVLSGDRTWSAEPPLMLEVPEDAWSEEFWAHVVLDEAAADADADTTSDETAFEDAPLMPLAGSSTGHTSSRYLPDDPPAVSGGAGLLASFVDHEASIVEALEPDPDPLPEPERLLDRPVPDRSESSLPQLPPRAAPAWSDAPLGPPVDRDADVPLLDVDAEDVPLIPIEQNWRTFLVAATLLLILGGAGLAGLVGGAVLATSATAPTDDGPEIVAQPAVEPSDAAEQGTETPEPPPARPDPAPRAPPVAVPAPRPRATPAPTVRVATPQPATTEAATTEAEPAAPPSQHDVLFRSFPFGAQLFVDGAAMGRAPRKLTLDAGAHQVRMVSGQQREEFSVTVDDQATEGWCYNFVQRTLVAGPCTAP